MFLSQLKNDIFMTVSWIRFLLKSRYPKITFPGGNKSEKA
ncbi:hypothetical protein B4098_0050 [Heyndrickxia coagulans]|uniref:Uncharacterized protein n=1 Tax=Heyndrickxia coagulans TaxID=1398 RepID=A0A150JR65_HEYCO|nr:hypothetical protein B4098_0050 [Heyndrickxia coagulans]